MGGNIINKIALVTFTLVKDKNINQKKHTSVKLQLIYIIFLSILIEECGVVKEIRKFSLEKRELE